MSRRARPEALGMGAEPDFSCIPCAGRHCSRLPLVERKACTPEKHLCPYEIEINADQGWLCRCCAECLRECLDDI
jgi:hypothetical protein